MSPEEVFIDCIGYRVAADLYSAGTDVVILNLIGFQSSKQRYEEFAQAVVNQTGATMLVLDYSGHGNSPFELEDLTPAQHFLEVVTAFDWLTTQYPDAKACVVGASFGGFMATQLTKYRTFDRLLLRVPALYEPQDFYTKWRDADTERRHEYRLHGDNLAQHPLLKRASLFGGKTFVITHELDDICPPHSTMPFVEAFAAEHWEAKGLKHGFSESDMSQEQKDDYYKKVAEWCK